MFTRLKQLLTEIESYYTRQASRGLERRRDEIDHFFMLICFCELYGIENPFAYHTLEMMPLLMPHYHRWHTKMGLSGDFFENFPCGCCC